MKYFFPTTTLNLDGILSSQLISPAGMYRMDTLWWNRFETILGQRKDSIILYNKLPLWEIDDSERDNYPLVVELDRTVLPKGGTREFVLEKPLKAVLVRSSIEFSALDLERRSVRFLFRSKAEKDRMLLKVSTSVAECKVVNMMRVDLADVFAVMPKAKMVSLQDAVRHLSERLEGIPDVESLEYPETLVEEERKRGAELGYQIGRYAKSLRAGTFVDAFRLPLSFMDWKKKVLPEPFMALLDYLSSRPLLPWDPNRVAMVAFCRDRWADCFRGKRVLGKRVLEGSALHVSLQNIARHWVSPEVPYRIAGEENPYMQAFAAFLECGAQANKYPRFIKESTLRNPEYLLALYGALVGYTSFSRILLDNNVYLPPQTKGITEVALEDSGRAFLHSGEYASLESKGALGTGHQKGCLIALPKPKRAVSEQSLFDYAVGEHHAQIQGKGLLVHDKELCAEIEKRFTDFGETRVQRLTNAVIKFCDRYTAPEGYYGKHPKEYRQTNPDLIDHLLRCFSSGKTVDMNFHLENEEKARFVAFLEERYNCEQRTHKA